MHISTTCTQAPLSLPCAAPVPRPAAALRPPLQAPRHVTRYHPNDGGQQQQQQQAPLLGQEQSFSLAFDVLDKDGDGLITQAEALRLVAFVNVSAHGGGESRPRATGLAAVRCAQGMHRTPTLRKTRPSRRQRSARAPPRRAPRPSRPPAPGQRASQRPPRRLPRRRRTGTSTLRPASPKRAPAGACCARCAHSWPGSSPGGCNGGRRARPICCGARWAWPRRWARSRCSRRTRRRCRSWGRCTSRWATARGGGGAALLAPLPVSRHAKEGRGRG